MRVLPLVFLLACPSTPKEESGGPIDTSPPGETGDTGDTGGQVPLDVTCSAAPQTFTVVVCDWTTAAPADSWVEFGETPDMGHTTPLLMGVTQHHHALYGMPASSTVWWRARTSTEGTPGAAEGTTETWDVPPEYPAFEVTVMDTAAMDPTPYFMGAVTWRGGAGMAMDRQGRAVWFYGHNLDVLPEYNVIQNLAVLPERGQVLLGAYSTAWDKGNALALPLSMEGLTGETVDLGLAHHMSIALPDGTWAWLENVFQSWTDSYGMVWNLQGDRIMERAPDGTQEEVFNVFDWVTPNPQEDWDPTRSIDWSHANTLEYLEDKDAYLISLGYLDTILEYDRSGRQVLRRFGGDAPTIPDDGGYGAGIPDVDFEVPYAEGTTHMRFPHGASLTDEGTLLTTTYDETRTTIWVVEYSVDSGVTREIWSWGQDLGLTSVAGGQAWRLPGGNTFFNAGTAGVIQEITPDGVLVWELRADLESSLVKVFPTPDFYGLWPTTPPPRPPGAGPREGG